ncbi:heavy metal translocating P-type ATPase [Natronococcus pandeyae]|uniref:Heavy metal translocating P-type ATPase n=1 Tax=Natronococcus pandeyae TaxID=2055836 RepID=A0A8J8Q385_9EURY|nr:cation-translocating P-type ATPase [Natronococcus pandeyae]TYL38447.1 heavy metal translocating P-type ATPase [Natronococcus pandeyae]
MSDSHAEGDRCRLCGTPLSETTVTAFGDAFCSGGCRDVYDALGEPGDGDEESADADPASCDGKTRAGGRAGTDRGQGDGEIGQDRPNEEQEIEPASAFFRIDGMHSALCESYLEQVADAHDGVLDATASYVTETVRVEYDPDHTSTAELRDVLSGVGYTAYRREEADDETTGETHRSREMTGLRKRRADDVLELRYIVGVVFGSFLLVPYITVFYPVYLSAFLEWEFFRRYGEVFATFDGILFLPLSLTLAGAVLYLTGMPLLRGAYVGLKLRRANTHLLATLTIVAAFAYGTLAFFLERSDIYYDLTIVVAATVMGAVFYEATIKRRALDRLTELTVSQVDEACRLETDGATNDVPVEELTAGDRVLVRQGERIPVDGVLAESACTVDEAVVTGESLPVSKRPGDDVVGGSVVTAGAAVVETGTETRSSIERLTETVWNLQSATHGVQRRADRLAAALVPLVVVAALTVGAAQFAFGRDATSTAMAVLLTVIVASPWALALAAPVSVASSIRDAMARGVVVFDETVFERLRGVDVVVFDKTGTLTTGEMRVLETDAPAELVRAASALEERAAHPAATAIAKAFDRGDDSQDRVRSDGGSVDGVSGEGDSPTVREFESHATGAEAVVDGQRVLVGHPDLFREQEWRLEPSLESRIEDARSGGRLPVVVGRDGSAEGVIVVGDEPRTEWADSVTRLCEAGIDVVVLTGDHAAASEFLERHADVTHVFADVPPAGKTAAIRRLAADREVAMVGDGTNDAPALAAADLGISLGSGTALAADAADLAILEDDLAAVERAFALSAAAGRRVTQNLGLALVYNAIAIPVALLGLLNPLVTAAGLAVTVLLIVANVSRPLIEDR